MLPLGRIIQFADISYHLFADDIQLSCSFKIPEAHKLSSVTNCLSQMKQWWSDNCLQLNSNKTGTLIIAPDSAIPGIKQHSGSLRQTSKTSLRSFGVIFAEAMSLEHHTKQLLKTC